MLEDLKEWLHKDPFIPFRIVLTSGSHYAVTSPYQVAIGQTQFDYYFPKSDRKATVRLNQLVAVETLDEVSPA
jgi:hypothetical protein